MSSERDRLKVYDELRKMHAILKEIPCREDDWEQNALDAVHAVLYLAEHVFTCVIETNSGKMPFIGWSRTEFREESHAESKSRNENQTQSPDAKSTRGRRAR